MNTMNIRMVAKDALSLKAEANAYADEESGFIQLGVFTEHFLADGFGSDRPPMKSSDYELLPEDGHYPPIVWRWTGGYRIGRRCHH